MGDDETNKKLNDAIVSYGDQYCFEYLAEYDPRNLETDWWQAFDFFLAGGHVSHGQSI
jgi:hypothetical protein